MTSPWMSALAEERSAQDAFFKLLQRDPQQAHDEFTQIMQYLVGERILFGDKPVPLMFPPFVLSSKRWQALAQSLDELNSVLTTLEPKLLESRWLDWLGFEPTEQEWIRLEHQIRPGQTISRVDGFLSEEPDNAGEYKIVELNIDSPEAAPS